MHVMRLEEMQRSCLLPHGRRVTHEIEREPDVMLRNLFRARRAVGTPPGGQCCAHGDDCSRCLVRMISAKTAFANCSLYLYIDHALLNAAHVGDRGPVRSIQAAHLTRSDEAEFSAVSVVQREVLDE